MLCRGAAALLTRSAMGNRPVFVLFQFPNASHLGAEDTSLIVYILQPVNAKLITNLPIPPKDILKDF